MSASVLPPPPHKVLASSSLSGRSVSAPLPGESKVIGASPLLSPANKIKDVDFRSLFDHIVADNQSEFEQKALGGIQLTQATASTTHNVEFGGNERRLQDTVKMWLDGLPNVTMRELMNPVKSSGSKRKACTRSSASGGTSNPPPSAEKRGEATLRTIFSKYAEFLNEDMKTERWEMYPDEPRGCLVTVRSMQDTACLNKKTRILFQGEYKNSERYVQMDGIRQCTGHLFHQLWWFRTIQGLFVENVYGFVVCGPKCRDIDDGQATVSLLVLCAPEKEIGSKLKLYEYKQVCQTTDKDLFCTLKSFVLQDWRKMDAKFVKEMKVPREALRPGSILIPTKFLNQYQSQNTWQIAPSGTAALVIRLYLTDKGKAKEFVTNLNIKNHVKTGLKMLIDREQKKMLYLKMKTCLLGDGWNRSDLLVKDANGILSDEQKQEIQTWTDIYALAHERSSSNVIVVMKDMGRRLLEVYSGLDFGLFCKEFSSMMHETLKVQELKGLCHGDIHEGNVVYRQESDEGKRMRLIDWDEASLEGPPGRELKNDTHKERYPEALVKDPTKYTKAQLLLLFRDLSRLYFDKYVYVDKQEVMRLSSASQDRDKKLAVTKDNVEIQFERLVDYLKSKSQPQGQSEPRESP